ncbi:PREDICTED: nuclear pore complex protein Nup133-like [Amphimedon queenslandica]|uniref:Uncharacterized protein n=1 Tax=Amphimedon queenslandica TaxID=400682 RepID=A0A1X7VH80_AMPQE|nr:PREDICTED: nuclear pore complex protein Nup133-like [Amphimedon queenslandica]|eukprot:XP_019849133.1 PREDICTED: nuclear pore complex protein Nup133-like [Amphimedon queenslandica]
METETEQFQQAFLLYLGNNMAEAVDLCSQLFPVSSFAGGVNTPGDVCSIRLSEMILNDVPASDPRWNKTDTLGSYSLIILNQLQDKQKAHRKLIQFLIDMELLNLLTCVTLRGSVLLTRNVLCENSEKIAASIALRENQNKDVEEAAKIVVQKRSPLSQIRPGLTTQDVFYSQVSLIDEIFPPLIQACESFSADGDMVGVTRIAFTIKSMLSSAIQYRISHVDLYTSSRPIRRVYHTEFIPWTACEEMLGLLRRLLSSMLDQWATCDDQPISDIDQESFWSVYSDLASILFTGSSDLYDSIKDHKDNEHRVLEVQNSLSKDKDHFILLALNLGRVGMALQLAEEWSHFPTILQVFEEQGDTELLRNYLEVFKDKGFDEFIFHYYIDNKNIKQLIELTNLFPESLSKFLNEYPELQWLHLIATDKYNEASESLRRVSDNEDTFLSRKKTALSLSKLALLAAGGHSSAKTVGELEEINCELQRIEYAEKLPENSLKKIGVKDINDLPPLPPEDVIKLFLEGEDNQLMYTMFALNYLLLAYPESESEERRQLQVLIWSHVLLQTNWSEFNTSGDIMEELQESLMFKLMNECHHNFADVKQLLPAIEDLLSSQLLVDKGLDSSAILIYCVKLCYERVTELQR